MDKEFVRKRQAHWERLRTLADRVEKKGLKSLSRFELGDLGELYRQATSDLAIAQRESRDPALVAYLNNLVGRAHGTIYQVKKSKLSDMRRFYRYQFPARVREAMPCILAALALFLAGGLFGYFTTRQDSDFANFFVSPDTQETIRQRKMWTEGINTIRPLASSFIATNNISVTFWAFALGITAGLGTMYVMTVNGVLLGVIAALCHKSGMSLRLWSFVLPHGVIELSTIFIAGGAGILLGAALVMPGERTRRDALVQNGLKAVQLILGCIPLLVIAGITEAYLSPSSIAPGYKFLYAGITLAGLILYLNSRGRDEEGTQEDLYEVKRQVR